MPNRLKSQVFLPLGKYGNTLLEGVCIFLFFYLFDRDNANKHSVKTKHVTEVLHIKFIAIANCQFSIFQGFYTQ